MIGLRFLPLDSADVCGTGTLDNGLRTTEWEASHQPFETETKRKPIETPKTHTVPSTEKLPYPALVAFREKK